jgi:hypothetical protein
MIHARKGQKKDAEKQYKAPALMQMKKARGCAVLRAVAGHLRYGEEEESKLWADR